MPWRFLSIAFAGSRTSGGASSRALRRKIRANSLPMAAQLRTRDRPWRHREGRSGVSRTVRNCVQVGEPTSRRVAKSWPGGSALRVDPHGVIDPPPTSSRSVAVPAARSTSPTSSASAEPSLAPVRAGTRIRHGPDAQQERGPRRGPRATRRPRPASVPWVATLRPSPYGALAGATARRRRIDCGRRAGVRRELLPRRRNMMRARFGSQPYCHEVGLHPFARCSPWSLARSNRGPGG
jgi:hypothetical protein